MIKILIADDHPIVRRGIKQIIDDAPDMEVTGEAENGGELLGKALSNHYDVVLLDISMPGRSGLEVLQELKSKKPNLPVLVLSMFSEEQYAVRALKSGASGYLTKAGAPEELIAAVRKVSQGRKYISPTVAEKLAREFGHMEKPSHETLSNREYQIMCLIASGKTLTQIADELFLSVKTISTYRSRILGKTTLKNNAELTHYAIQHGLVD